MTENSIHQILNQYWSIIKIKKKNCKIISKVFEKYLKNFSNVNADTFHLKTSNANANTFQKYLKCI